MSTLLGSFFAQPLPVAAYWFWLVFPVCLTVSLVYKATKVQRFAEIFPAAAILFLTMIAGLTAVAIGLWLLIRVYPS